MSMRAWGRVFLGLLAAGSVACGSAGGGSPAGDDDVSPPADVDPTQASPDDVSYRFVDTPEGVTLEASSSEQVQTSFCPSRTCGGLCGECAAAACRLMGSADSACRSLEASCQAACNCDTGRCGFPVCAENPRVCYEAGPAAPSQAEPDPAPFDRDGAGSSPSNAGTPEP